jgi:hypothetical protein
LVSAFGGSDMLVVPSSQVKARKTINGFRQVTP